MKVSRTLSIILAAAITALTLSPAFAATKTVALDVPTMHCPTCPITVKKALLKVKGVSKVTANLDKREAVVTFDDVQTTVEALIKATGDAGYPSRIVEGHP